MGDGWVEAGVKSREESDGKEGLRERRDIGKGMSDRGRSKRWDARGEGEE